MQVPLRTAGSYEALTKQLAMTLVHSGMLIATASSYAPTIAWRFLPDPDAATDASNGAFRGSQIAAMYANAQHFLPRVAGLSMRAFVIIVNHRNV